MLARNIPFAFAPFAFALAVLAAPGFVTSAWAQESGGLRINPAVPGGPVGLARPLPFTPPPFVTPQQLQNGLTGADHQAKNQQMITALRGDPGFLSGFHFGTPLAASVQKVPGQFPDPFAGQDPGQFDGQGLPNDGGYRYRRHHGHGNGPIIINEGPTTVAVGNGNVIQQQTVQGASGPVALQQVSNGPGSAPGNAVNMAGGVPIRR